MEWLNNVDIILASQSPRRKLLLEQMGIPFRIVQVHINETPPLLPPPEVAIYLSELKSKAIPETEFQDVTIAITADTFVVLDENLIVGKPESRDHAVSMLKTLSGRMHKVYSGITLRSKYHMHSFSVESRVWFRQLDDTEINYYLDHYMPYDKAGSYGIQEWIGYVGVERIEGSFFNIMGLPTCELYVELKNFINRTLNIQ